MKNKCSYVLMGIWKTKDTDENKITLYLNQ